MKMKKTYLILAFMVCCHSQAQVFNSPDDLCTTQKGWDIYTAGTYRYGPSFMYYEDGKIDGWFAASGGTYGKRYYRGTQSPVRIRDYNTVGQVFTANEDFYRVSICCPTWNSSNETVTISVYAWDRTYTRTIRSTPLYTKNIKMTDNMWIDGFYSNEAETDTSIRFPAGRYLWVLSNPSSTAGVWHYSEKANGVSTIAYENGNQINGSFYMITQEPGSSIYWDCPTYQHSNDGGKTWSTERIALLPTQGSRDELSACDPGVIRFGGYYYLGYTSTENQAGVDNHLYMARSTSPTGPWEKWNGSGWGGRNPQPIVTYTDNHEKWGCGEPSMVVVDNVLYLYYTWENGIVTTRLATAPADDENWPASLKYVGTVINKSNYSASDHCDIKYIDDIQCFVAMHTSSRMSTSAYINVWISRNGKSFTHLGKLSGPTQKGLHNLGLSGDEMGHMQLNKPQFVAYAYGLDSWGKWNTYLQPLDFREELMTLIRNAQTDPNLDEEARYNLQGIRIPHSASGIYIKGRKKYFRP